MMYAPNNAQFMRAYIYLYNTSENTIKSLVISALNKCHVFGTTSEYVHIRQIQNTKARSL